MSKTDQPDLSAADSTAAPSDPASVNSRRSVWGWALLSSVLTWLAFPPVGWSWLAWVAPCGWLMLVARPRLPSGRSKWLAMWVASSVFWLVYLQGVRLAHPALYLGWFALSAYLAIYAPIFVALTRLAVHRFRWPLLLAAPVTWVALELIRGAFATGFSGGLAGHMLTRWPLFIQVADLGGAYAVSFVVISTAACVVALGTWWHARRAAAGAGTETRRDGRSVVIATACGAVLLIGDATYGWWRLRETTEVPEASRGADQRLRIAVIQESIDTIFEFNESRNREAFERYRQNTLNILRQQGGVDLIVWPESSFTENSPDIVVKDGVPNGELARRIRAFDDRTSRLMADIREAGGGDVGGGDFGGEDAPRTWLVAGTVTVEVSPQGVREYNSALLIDPTGRVADRYYKQHLVMFGEYIPLGNWFPWLYRLAGMPGGLVEGPQPSVFEVRGAKLSPSICFESMVPHLVRRQVAYGRQSGRAPDVLVNVTNDGWFWGSSILDTHLQSGIFRAIEHRRTFVIAANTGLSAVIDRHGRALTLPRRTAGALVVDVPTSGSGSARDGDFGRDDRRDVGDAGGTVYQRVGDWPWCGCVLAVAGVVLSAVAGRGVGRTSTGGRDRRDQTTQTA